MIAFFSELGLELEGRATIEGAWAGRVTGLGDQHVEVAMMRTPDGHGRLATLARLRPHGAQLVGEVVQYQDVYRLCYLRGLCGLLIGLAEELG